VVEKKNFPSPKEDSVTDLGQTYQRVSIYLHAGTKLFPERTRLLTSDSAHHYASMSFTPFIWALLDVFPVHTPAMPYAMYDVQSTLVRTTQ
jgi:hypothetical protein